MNAPAAAAEPAQRNPFTYPDFRLYFLSRVLAGLATQVFNVTVGWLVYDFTRSAWMLGLIGLTTFLPVMVLALLAGHVADSFDRRRIIATAWMVIGASLTVLALHVSTGSREVWPIFGLGLGIGVARAFSNPAAQALIPSLVARRDMPGAITWASSSWQASSVVGPGVGGLLLLVSPVFALGCGAAAFLTASFMIRLIRARTTLSRRPMTVTDVLGGIRFIRSQPLILGALSLDLFAVLFGGATALLPIFAADILQIGAAGLGLLRAMPAVGAITMTLVLARWPLRRRVGRRMLTAIAIYGLAIVGFGLSTDLYLSLALLVVSGAADMINVVVRQSLVQGLTPDEMRGRVAAVNSVFIGASNELGEFESGVVAGLIGAVPAVVIGGTATVGIALLWSRLFPQLRDRDRLFDAPDKAPT